MNKLRLSCLIGTAFEFFEFQIFAMLLPYLVVHFFGSTTHAFVEGYLAFGVAFIARPIGGVLLGYIGDRYGRRSALLIAMWLMAGSTLLIGLLPGYALIGMCAGIFLLMCRVAQGLSLGGEFSSGAVFLFEHQQRPTCYSLIWLDLGGSGGLFLAILTVLITSVLFTTEEMQAFAWRLPFLAAFGLSLCGIYIRRSLTHPNPHTLLVAQNKNRTTGAYYREVFHDWKSLILLTLSCAPNGIFWYLQVIFIPNQMMSLSPKIMLGLMSITLLAIPIAGKLADRFLPFRVWMFSIMGLVLNFVLCIMSTQTSLQRTGLVLQALLLALNQGPRFMILNTSFPLAVRATSCALIYSVANLFGGMTPLIAFWLYNRTPNHQSLMWVLCMVGCISLSAMGLMAIRYRHKKREKSIVA